MKKKVISALLATAMVATMVAGCGSKKPAETTAATEAAAETEAAAADTEAESVAEAVEDAGVDLADANVAVFYYTFSDTYISSVRTALDGALDGLGVKYQDFDANSNQTTQNEQIDTALQTGANVLVVNIVTSGSVDASQQIVDKAAAANNGEGVPVIFFNRAVETDEE